MPQLDELFRKPAMVAALALLAALPAPAQDGTPSTTGGTEGPAPEATKATERYAVAKTAGARVLTMPDKKGPAVVVLEAGQILRLAGAKRAAYLPVEIPGGFPVWVHGRNLKPGDEEGVLRVTANAVLQRPLPSTGLDSYPLELRLHGGDMLRIIERNDETKPLEEDWVRVWSAPGSFGYVDASMLDPVADSTVGAQLWQEELALLGERTTLAPSEPVAGEDPLPGAKPKPAAAPVASKEARELLDAADALLASEREKATPDFAAVRAAYDQVLALGAGATYDRDARAGLRLLGAIQEAKALESDLEAEKIRRTEDVLTRQRRIWEESRKRDPLIGRYDARGVLERKSRAGQPHRYVLRWGPDLVCEVRCESGRYDLDLFAGYELGLKGLLTYASPDALLVERPVLEVGRIEVLKRR
ncbi:MAG: hypothetical protein P1V81_06690 [Planctomycetota bacterium]|nr:hypothetical protein [Planctomycetota bacterium]